jgi:hypothetical protein
LTTFINKYLKDYGKNTESKINDITNCKTSKKRLLAVEYTISIRYYYQKAKTRA